MVIMNTQYQKLKCIRDQARNSLILLEVKSNNMSLVSNTVKDIAEINISLYQARMFFFNAQREINIFITNSER